jgi:acetylornithine deacetylase/succinyl-diaminopimelate desuccinylase-like protein
VYDPVTARTSGSPLPWKTTWSHWVARNASPAVGFGLGRMGREHIANEYFTVEGLRLYEKFVVTFLHEFARL